MSFTQAVRSGFQNYANFSGRALRSEYWWWILFGIVSGSIVSIIDLAIGTTSLSFAFSAVLLVPGIAVTTRRLHDRGHSGWFQLIAIVPVIGWIYLLVQFVSKGDESLNKYGPPRTL